MAGINFSTVPVVMMELGEMKNPGEARVMRTARGRQRYAAAVAAGIAAWLRSQ
ncbi:MAG: N-acetylmuramoyl-L-alanine amidase [Bifidobacteriaceae bacterium]|nr:N-acetylmuramoyl-L-alanine amidase [Bifidobacteriaceae bacterium]